MGILFLVILCIYALVILLVVGAAGFARAGRHF
jgi:hypothetical protein